MRALRIVANDQARHPKPRSLDDEIRSILAALDNHRVGMRNLEKALARLGRRFADERGEFMLPGEARLRRDVGAR